MELMAVAGMTLADTSVTSGAPAITVISQPSSKANVGGSGVYFGGVNIEIAPGSTDGAGCTLAGPDPVSGTIPPSSQKGRNGSNEFANRVGDSETLTGAGTLSGGSDCTASFKIEIVDAGQQKASVN